MRISSVAISLALGVSIAAPTPHAISQERGYWEGVYKDDKAIDECYNKPRRGADGRLLETPDECVRRRVYKPKVRREKREMRQQAIEERNQQIEMQNAEIEAENEARRQRSSAVSRRESAQWNAKPTGVPLAGVKANGQPLTKCSHGGLCHGELVRQMQRSMGGY